MIKKRLNPKKIIFAVFVFLIAAFVLIVLRSFYFPGHVNVLSLGLNCRAEITCGNLVGVNCRAEVDGPYYYVNKNTGQIVEYCGGYCQVPSGKYCRHCPPKEWTCEKSAQ